MIYPIDELLDKRSIIQLKIERIEDVSDKKRLKKEFEEYTQAIEQYIKEGTCNSIQALKWHERLYKANGDIWDLESNIRKGQLGNMTLEAVGKTAILIREKNGIRISIKSEIVKVTGVGHQDIRINHASSTIVK